jgi:hypothetical protein
MTIIWNAASDMASIHPAMMAQRENAEVSSVICRDIGIDVRNTCSISVRVTRACL